MDKLEVFEYLNSGVDKSGSLKKVGGFKKHYPELYENFLKVIFIDEIKDLPFKQKLWHFLQDVYVIPTCKICGKPVNFLTRKGQWGYCTYCSGQCAMQDDEIKKKLDNTKEERYGDRKYNNVEKQKETLSKKDETFWDNRTQKSLETRYKENDGRYFSKESLTKITETKSKNNTFNTSTIEELFNNFLISIFDVNFFRQYNSEDYPFNCDFYIPIINLYIEIQGIWSHGKHPFDMNNPNDVEILNMWKNKCSDFYNNAIYVWTTSDVNKRNIARTNNLNYLEIFSNDIDTCIDKFNEYLTTLITNYCLTSPFPGTPKWESNHPIWDCNVGRRLSPRQAWLNKKYVEKAVNNLLKMVYKDEPLRKRFLRELSTCIIQNNTIVSSSQRFLQLILDRFTIAKIAPKVTALSPKTFLNILNESGIDLSSGVYVPMAGFGGIVEGYKKWCEEHNKKPNYESYDINPNFCKWYGWEQKDMLEHYIVTDKTCICCPPFGKEFEHWNGTPKNMSEKSFKDWYNLIKKHVHAPNYIIIGPEIHSKNDVGLFSKKVGVMRWTDEMINNI